MLSPYIAHPCAAALAPACPGDRAGAVGIGWTVLIPSGAVPRVAESRIRAAKVLSENIESSYLYGSDFAAGAQ